MVAKSRKSVKTDMIAAAVVALGERNGSTVKSIFNFLLRSRKARPSSRAKVVLAIRRAVKSGILTKKSPNTFVVRATRQSSTTALAKNQKRKTRRMRKKSVKKTTKRRRRQRKRKSLKKRSGRSSEKSKRTARKPQKKRRTKVNRKRKSQVKVVQKTVQRKRYSRYPLRKAARGIRYTA